MKTDYLIVGAGAVGMAFADTLLTETDAHIIMVDRFAKPGGHWNNAYPYVTLHQPSAFYGVASQELSKGRRDEMGLNKGLADLATGQDVMAYFDDVMRHTFLPTGRVKYFPMCDFKGEGAFMNRLSGETYTVEYETLVDCTYLNTNVPLTHKPNFTVDEDVNFIPLNHLPNLLVPPEGFVIIGGGKTGIDAILWLLDMGVDPDKISWVISRDAWLIDRENTQNHDDFFFSTMSTQANQFEAIAQSESIEDMFDKLEACGYFLRLDMDVRPTMFHGATISKAELEQLRRVKNIIRKGRVTHIGVDKISLVQGDVSTTLGHVHVDCSASALLDVVPKPVYEAGKITPQTVRSYQPVFSASMIAWIEAKHKSDVAKKNSLTGIVPLPNKDIDYIRFTAANMMNQFNWSQDADIRKFMYGNRLDGFSKLVGDIGGNAEKKAVMKKLRDNAFPAMGKLQAYIAQLDAG